MHDIVRHTPHFVFSHALPRISMRVTLLQRPGQVLLLVAEMRSDEMPISPAAFETALEASKTFFGIFSRILLSFSFACRNFLHVEVAGMPCTPEYERYQCVLRVELLDVLVPAALWAICRLRWQLQVREEEFTLAFACFLSWCKFVLMCFYVVGMCINWQLGVGSVTPELRVDRRCAWDSFGRQPLPQSSSRMRGGGGQAWGHRGAEGGEVCSGNAAGYPRGWMVDREERGGRLRVRYAGMRGRRGRMERSRPARQCPG